MPPDDLEPEHLHCPNEGVHSPDTATQARSRSLSWHTGRSESPLLSTTQTLPLTRKRASPDTWDTEDGYPHKRGHTEKLEKLAKVIRIAQKESRGQPILSTAARFMRVRGTALTTLGMADATQTSKDTIHVDSMCLFLAKRVFGSEAITRLAAMVSIIRDIPDPVVFREPEAGVGLRGSNLFLPVIKAYRTQASTRTNAVVYKCLRFVHLSNFYQEYNSLLDDVLISDSPTQQALKGQGLRPSRGRSWKDTLLDWLIFKLDGVSLDTVAEDRIARRRIKNEITTARHFHMLEKAFGVGVFALLPEDCLAM